MGDGKFKWYFAEGKDPEHFHVNCDTREQAIAEAKTYGYEKGFTVLEADHAVPAFPSGQDIIDLIEDQNADLSAEDEYFEIEASNEQVADLNHVIYQTVKDWFDRHDVWPIVYSFGEMRNQEYFPPDESPPT